MNEIRIPKPGDAITEAVLAKVLVADGESVAEGEPLYELETDKVEMVIDAPWSGRRVVEGRGRRDLPRRHTHRDDHLTESNRQPPTSRGPVSSSAGS